jgi:hypothetical protein
MKTYTDEEINSLIDELQKELPAILKAEAQANAEELAKKESNPVTKPLASVAGGGSVPAGSKMPDVANGANGGDQKGGTITGGKDGGGKNQPSPGPAGYLSKDESASSKPPPKSEPADDEGGGDDGDSGGDSAPSASASDSDGPPADASASAAPSPSPAPAAGPDAGASPSADPAMGSPDQMGGGDQLSQLKQAYSALPDPELQMHFEALKDAVMARMGDQSQMGASSVAAPDASAMGSAQAGPAMPDMAASSSAAPAPDASASMPPPPPAQKAMPPMAGAPMGKAAPSPNMIVKSEKTAEEQALSKAAEERIAGLEKSLEGVTNLLESILTKPVQKSVTSMVEFMAKSDAEKAAPVKLSKAELMKKVAEKAKQPDLKKSDRDVINRYVLSGEGLADLEKLLAS